MEFRNLKEINKAYTEGIYSDSPLNRKLGRVGMTYQTYADKVNKEKSENSTKKEEVKDIDSTVKKEEIFKIPSGFESHFDNTMWTWNRRGGYEGGKKVQNQIESLKKQGWKIDKEKTDENPSNGNYSDTTYLVSPDGKMKFEGYKHIGDTSSNNSYSMTFKKVDESNSNTKITNEFIKEKIKKVLTPANYRENLKKALKSIEKEAPEINIENFIGSKEDLKSLKAGDIIYSVSVDLNEKTKETQLDTITGPLKVVKVTAKKNSKYGQIDLLVRGEKGKGVISVPSDEDYGTISNFETGYYLKVKGKKVDMSLAKLYFKA